MNIKIIEETNQENFKAEIIKAIENGYKVKNTNIAITEDNTKRTTKFDRPIITKIYYAYLEKEI